LANYKPLERYAIEYKDIDIKILGWQSADIVYFVEKQANSNDIHLLQYDYQNKSETLIAKMNRFDSYYNHLFTREQISITHQKVAYLVHGPSAGIQDLMVANLDGTEAQVVINRIRDLPSGLPIIVQ